MAKNLMPEILKMLGVEYGEKFKLRAVDSEICEAGLFYFDKENGFLRCMDEESPKEVYDLVYDVVSGYYEVVKLPWEPKYGKHFYTYIHNEAHNEWLVEWFYWYGAPNQLALKQLGMVFKTQEDAEKALPEFYEKLTGKKLEVGND